jgi:hypothetical protein
MPCSIESSSQQLKVPTLRNASDEIKFGACEPSMPVAALRITLNFSTKPQSKPGEKRRRCEVYLVGLPQTVK